MRTLLSIFSILILANSFSQDFKPANNTSQIKSELKRQMDAVSSIQADFKEYVFSTMFKEPQSGYGKFTYQKENQVRWDHRSVNQLILINGTETKLYESGKLVSNPTSKRIVKQIQNLMISMLSGDFLSENQFTIQYYSSPADYRLVLKPKNPRMARYISTIKLDFNKKTKLLNKISMIEKNGQKIIYAFSNLQVNHKISQATFTQR